MDLNKKEIKESIIGSLVCMTSDDGELGISKSGVGIILDIRKEKGNILAKIVWTRSPFFSFKEERKVGWHLFERLFILQNKNGVKINVYKN